MSATRRRLAALAALAAVLAPRSLAAASQMPAAGGAQQLLAGGGASDTSSAASWTSPPFCHGLECPRYSTLPCAAKGVELRRYAPSTWVSTVVTGASYDDAVNQGFGLLFSYISGANAAGVKIPMTAPVATDVAPGAGPTCGSNFTVSFFAPPGAPPPPPTSPALFLRDVPGRDVYVAVFGGWAEQRVVVKEAAAAAQRLADAGVAAVNADGGFTVAAYDSPFRLLDRHNEIWFVASPAGSDG